MKLESGGHDVVRHGAALICSESHEYLQPADITAPLVVVVHGLTSSGEYLGALERYIHRHESHECKKYLCAMFNYDSYLGIDFAGQVLAHLLGDFKNQIRQYGLVLVAHSMGGLVIRYAISLLAANDIKVLGLILLGTPNTGFFGKRFFVDRLLDWAEVVSTSNPYLRQSACPAVRQLIGSDQEHLIETLNAASLNLSHHPPTLSISGGLGYWELAQGQWNFRDRIANLIIQWQLNERPNDGLVPESASDLRKVISGDPNIQHVNSYPEYKQINHSGLTGNQSIFQKIAAFLDEIT